jgi:hypothetical protein
MVLPAYRNIFRLAELLLFHLVGTVCYSQHHFNADSSLVITAANPELKGDGLKRTFIGKNYRQEWTAPIQVQVLHFDQLHWKPTKEGGGKQTRSLKVEDEIGNEYSLRSIRKYPEKAIPEELRHTVFEKIIMDGVSESYPYGALSMTPLSIAAGVPYFEKYLGFIGDDPTLGEFRSKYKNMLSLVESEKPSGILTKKEDEKIKTYDTDELVYELQQSNKNKVDQEEVLRARLLDNFVMDFDRHEKQWKWAHLDSGDNKIYIAIPKDHDQVFFTNHGVIPKIVKGGLPELQGFRAKAINPVTFNRPAFNFDNYFLNNLSELQWRSAINSLLSTMTDSVIDAAMKQQPPEILDYSTPKIAELMKEKKKYFSNDMLKYYRHLSKVVSVVGSNDAEDFQLMMQDGGRLLVIVTDTSGKGIYERVFDPAVTKEVRLYGLEGNDRFHIEGGTTPIKIRLIGGPGDDQFINNGADKKIFVYDLTDEKNLVCGPTHVKNKMNDDPMVNEYERLGYKLDHSGIGIYSEYAFDGGLYIGARWRSTKEGFRKIPYASQQDFIVGHTLALNSFLFRYNADFMQAIGNSDIVIRGEYFMPTARTNFFGTGNETVFDQTKPGGIKYYRARYDLAKLTVMMRTPITSWMNYSYGPSFQYFQFPRKENDGNFITTLDHSATDDNKLHESNFYGGGEFQWNINTRNNEMLPTRGIAFNSTVQSLVPLKGDASTLTQVNSDLAMYSDFLSMKRVVLAARFGAGYNFGDYLVPQAQYLGFRENLRGFRIHRFAGRGMAYNNIELRWKIADLKTFLFPAAFGIVGYNDIGRVWADNENSSTWHDGYGGGLWIAPFNKLVITGTLSYSNEEKNFALLTFGFQF